MLKFIVNFFLFGILFYLIWLFFPEAFETLVSWAGTVFDFFKSLIQTAIERMNSNKGTV